MTWFRKYRPTTVAGLHLTQVRQVIQNFMAQGRLPQVMLFAGPKGTGKTSTARIIAALLNDPSNQPLVAHRFFNQPAPATMIFSEPSADDASAASIFKGTSYVVQELDAASHRGIDDVRAIKEQVAVPPQGGVMSVYILDEVHMLTTEAFNALLKLLEEPPNHAVFILATTEAHKIPATIASRATLVPFTKANPDEISAALENVLRAEKIEFEAEALQSIATRADGSFRDAVKLLETVAYGQSKLTVAAVQALLNSSVNDQLDQVISAVLAKDATQVSFIFRQLRELGVNADYFLQTLLQSLHKTLLQNLGVEPGKPGLSQAVSHFLLQELQSLPKNENSSIPFLALELKLLELIFRSQNKGGKPAEVTHKGRDEASVSSERRAGTASASPSSISLRQAAPESTVLISTPVVTPSEILDKEDDIQEPTLKVQQSDNLSELNPGDSQKLLEQWDAFVELMKEKNSSVAALLKSAKPLSATGATAQIAVFYKFHQEQLQQPKFLMMMQECLKPVTGGPITFEFILQQPVAQQSSDKDLASLAVELLV
jgi:DNA polymerase-3 subunit gamma/tau